MVRLTIFSTELETKAKDWEMKRQSGGPSNGSSCTEVNDTKENGLPRGNFRNSLHVMALSSFVLAFMWNCSGNPAAVDCFSQGTRCRSVLLSIGNKIAIDSS